MKSSWPRLLIVELLDNEQLAYVIHTMVQQQHWLLQVIPGSRRWYQN